MLVSAKHQHESAIGVRMSPRSWTSLPLIASIWTWVCHPFGEGNGNSVQYSCLENPMDGGAWKAAVHGVAQSRTWLKWLSSSSSSSGSDGKESACNEGDLDSIPGLEISPGKGNGYPLQYSYLKNPHGQKSLVGYSPWSHKESDMTEQLSTYTSFYFNPSIFINPSEIGDFHFPYDESSFDSHIS